MDRRAFLRGSLGAAGGAVLAGSRLGDLTVARSRPLRLTPDRVLDLPAAESPIDTIVVVVLENRSFDHVLGWLADDKRYLDRGRRRHGHDFHVAGSIHERYKTPNGKILATRDIFDVLHSEAAALRGCTFKVPGHTWDAGRVQRDHGFLARGTGNDEYAVTYFDGSSIPHHRAIAEQFTILDQYYASLLGPTFPNRQYIHSAQSEGQKGDPGPLRTGIFTSETIWDRLAAANVPATYYYTDLPLLRLWGTRMKPFIASLDRYFEQAASGTLPNVSMIDPSFTGVRRADAHPRGDIRIAAAFAIAVLEALLRSPQWSRSLFFLTYDEWGGFYDHLPPPHFPDDRASRNDADDFGQAGFRAAAALMSPYSPKNAVDHTVYDHTSILRFIEWRFLGAPASGPAASSGRWWLTKRDRHANPIGQTLRAHIVNRDIPDQLVPRGVAAEVTLACAEQAEVEEKPFVTHPSFDEERARDHPEATHRPWEVP